jgi:integrase/recombinase XerC
MTDEYLKLLDGFKTYLEIKNYKPRGIEGKLRYAKYFFIYLFENNLDLNCFTVKDAETYREYLAVSKDKNGTTRFNPSTINGFLSGLKLLYKYLISTNKASFNPFSSIEKMKESIQLPKNILSIEQMGKLLDVAQVESMNDFKFKVVLEVLYSTGARINEIENLRKKVIDFDRGVITILDDKDRKDRIAPLSEYAVNILNLYAGYFKDDDKLFMRGAKRTLNRFVNDRLKRLSKKHDFPLITCHSIRHTTASHLLKKGADIREVQEILGHKRIKNTEIYTRLMTEDLKKVIDKLHPREC